MSRMFSKPVAVFVIFCFALFPNLSYALPQGENVVAGNATFDRSQTNTLNINQTTGKLITNYQSFSIGKPEAVNFHQPTSSSVALNRVVGIEPSAILGKLTANGKVFLINPNGIMFGQGAVIDAAGMVASTLDISNEDFLAGRYTFYGPGGTVVNQGYISAPGGYVSLLGSQVLNEGVIEADLGSVVLASGDAVTLNLDPAGFISVVIDAATSQNLESADAAVKNTGTIKANGGKVILSAKTLDGVFDQAVNNEGIIEAKSLINNKGQVYIRADGENALASTTGTIDVSAFEPGADGGYIEICGIKIFVDGKIDASSLYGKPGELLIDPLDLYILSGSAGGDYDPGHTYEGVSEYWLESQDGYNITLQADRDVYSDLTGHLEIVGWKWGFIPIFDFVADNELNMANFDTETFRIEAGRNIYLGNDSVVTSGGNIALLADYNQNNDGGITWNPLDMGGLYSQGGDIVLGGADVRLAYGSHSATVDAGAGTVYLVPSTHEGMNATIELGTDDLNPYTFDLTDNDLDAIVSQTVSIGINSQNPSVPVPGGVPYAETGTIDIVDGLTQGGKTLTLNTRGSINDAHSGLDIQADALLLSAYGDIGSSQNGALDTDVNDLWAISQHGDIYVNEANSINLKDIAVYHSVIDITSGGYMRAENVANYGGGGNDDIRLTVLSDDLEVDNIYAAGWGDVILNAADDIEDTDHNSLIKADDLKMYAGDDIGRFHERINTDVNDLWAISQGGSVYLHESDGVSLWDIQALGSVVDIMSGGKTFVYNVLATGSGWNDPAIVNLDVNHGGLYVYGEVQALRYGNGQAKIDIDADYGVNVYNDVTAKVFGYCGIADVDIYSKYGDVNVQGIHTDIEAAVTHNGSASVELTGKDVTITQADVRAKVGNDGKAEVTLKGTTGCRGGDVTVRGYDADVEALVGDDGSAYGPDAAVTIIAEDITVEQSDVRAVVGDDGFAQVKFISNGHRADIIVDGACADVEAIVNDDGIAQVIFKAGDTIVVDAAQVTAQVADNGMAKVEFDADKGITVDHGKVKALVDGRGHAEIEFDTTSRGADIRIARGSELLARVGGGDNSAIVDLDSHGKIDVFNSSIKAINETHGPATVKLEAKRNINLIHSFLAARTNIGSALVELATRCGDVIARCGSAVIAKVTRCGKAEVEVDSGDKILVKNSIVNASVRHHGHAEVDLAAEGNVTVINSMVSAGTGSGPHTAVVEMDSGASINLFNSWIMANNYNGPARVSLAADDDIFVGGRTSVLARSWGGGDHGILNDYALVMMTAGGDISSYGRVKAKNESGLAGVAMLAGGNIDAFGRVRAVSNGSFAGVFMGALGDVYASNVVARGAEGVDAVSALESLISCWYMPTDIVTQYSYDSAIVLGSLQGDVTLGYLEADMVLAAALGGNINDASVYDTVGDVYAHYLGMLAYGNIGTADDPINTFVDIVSAYSWGEGDIYINEYDDIEIGLYLPILQPVYPEGEGQPQWVQTAAIGASVAANNGIVHITAGEDMIVNSIIAPRGGVFLESQQGSIYAGHGWCPAVYSQQEELPYALAQMPESGRSSLLEEFLMEGWSQYAREGSAAPDYFSPVMFGAPDLPAGPNVIAGGASYFSTPGGTIGVGVPGSPRVYNPLQVCIQVVPESHSALPEGYSPPMKSTPWGLEPVGLTLNIGGSTAGVFEIDTGDGNGPLGVSGMIKGIVRPGVAAVTGVYPSPALYPTNDDPLYPSGYVFYEDTDAQCCSPLYGPAALNQGMLQIWPKPVPAVLNASFNDLFPVNLRAYFEILNAHRVTSFLPATPTQFFAYHPLTETDMTAFDGIGLDVGAYEFIDDNINVNEDSPYLGVEGQDNGKKKKKKFF